VKTIRTDTAPSACRYDLANTILVRTSEGHVVVDVAMSPAKSRIIRAALTDKAGDAPIHSIIYTHSHIDHVGGASGWAGNATRIWATDKLTGHFFKQYGVFRKVNLRGGAAGEGKKECWSRLLDTSPRSTATHALPLLTHTQPHPNHHPPPTD
jgi:glyoxylase-like metal-dependent hydrolase (beta-lactamase superfamily II)